MASLSLEITGMKISFAFGIFVEQLGGADRAKLLSHHSLGLISDSHPSVFPLAVWPGRGIGWERVTPGRERGTGKGRDLLQR